MRYIFLFSFCFLISAMLLGQERKKNQGRLPKPKADQQEKFLKKQWWLGFKAGGNLTQADPIKRYTVLTPTNYPAGKADKSYDGFKSLGSQAGIEVSFQYENFLISTQPTYRQSRYTYSNQFRWTSESDINQSLIQNYKQEQKIDYADIPLIIKYTIGNGRFRPFIQIGIYYSFLINATQTVKLSGTDMASGGSNQFSSEPVIVGAKDLFADYWSLGAGTGVTYQLGNVQLILDASYRKGMSNVANVKNRFSNDRLSGIGDVQDDVKISNVIISAGVLFPMRFLNSNFKSFDRK